MADSNKMVRRGTPNMGTAARNWGLDRLFEDDLFSPLNVFGRLGENLSRTSWAPPVDIRETDESYEVSADLPGMGKDDVKVQVEDNLLTIHGERRHAEETREDDYRRRERMYGTFTRSFTLPREVDSDGVKASFQDGVLNVTIPKSDKARPRTITIE